MRHDPYWARVVAAVDRDAMREMDAVLGDLDSFAKHMDTEIRDCLGPQIADDVMDYGQQLRRLDAGLPNTLTPDDLRGMIDSRRALAALVEAKRREHLTVVD